MKMIGIICTVLGGIASLYWFNRFYSETEQVRLIAVQNGEKISPFYGIRGCFQPWRFARKYTNASSRRLWLFSFGAWVSGLITLVGLVLIMKQTGIIK